MVLLHGNKQDIQPKQICLQILPVITGDTKGKPGEEYHYTVTTTDVDSDDVYYYVNWSDNTTNQLVGPYHSGEEATLNHTWSEKGTYTRKSKSQGYLWGGKRLCDPGN